jgi:hypothetical protein
MSTWVIVSWIFVAVLTGVNIYVFWKLKQASEQMLKMAFPGAKDMNDALSQMQKMMGSMGVDTKNMGGLAAMAKQMRPQAQAPKAVAGNSDAQLKAAMSMLQNMQKNAKR